uniref:Uncharacterized protein n=1 Tax=Zea mays TaxID=4577 RepID=A0A804QSM5_MAIZE
MSSCLILSGFFEKETWMHPIFPALFYACERVIRKFHENDYHSGIVSNLSGRCALYSHEEASGFQVLKWNASFFCKIPSLAFRLAPLLYNSGTRR